MRRLPAFAPCLLLLACAFAAGACKRHHAGRASGERERGSAPSSPPHAPPPGAKGKLVVTDGGATVYDPERDLTWLADFNLPRSQSFGVEGVMKSGAMSYKTALQWVEALNQRRHLGHASWELPTTPPSDPGCDRKNRYNFGYGCRSSAYGALYHLALGLAAPQSAVAMSKTPAVKGFVNFQPYLYWSDSANANHPDNENGFTTFSFGNGFQGSNVQRNTIYALPMIEGRFEPADRAKVVFDGENTWLADANLGATQTFGVKGIAPSGAMPRDVALQWIAAMNAVDGGKGYLGTNRWRLPPTAKDDRCSHNDFGFECTGSPMGKLYYGYLGHKRGEPVTQVPDVAVGPFRGVQPYLYWSCHAADNGKGCSPRKEDPVAGFGWTFSFGNGFQGTTTRENLLYVTAVHPGPPGGKTPPSP